MDLVVTDKDTSTLSKEKKVRRRSHTHKRQTKKQKMYEWQKKSQDNYMPATAFSVIATPFSADEALSAEFAIGLDISESSHSLGGAVKRKIRPARTPPTSGPTM